MRQGYPLYHGQRATDIHNWARISVMARTVRQGYQWLRGYPYGYPFTRISLRISVRTKHGMFDPGSFVLSGFLIDYLDFHGTSSAFQITETNPYFQSMCLAWMSPISSLKRRQVILPTWASSRTWTYRLCQSRFRPLKLKLCPQELPRSPPGSSRAIIAEKFSTWNLVCSSIGAGNVGKNRGFGVPSARIEQNGELILTDISIHCILKWNKSLFFVQLTLQTVLMYFFFISV